MKKVLIAIAMFLLVACSSGTKTEYGNLYEKVLKKYVNDNYVSLQQEQSDGSTYYDFYFVDNADKVYDSALYVQETDNQIEKIYFDAEETELIKSVANYLDIKKVKLDDGSEKTFSDYLESGEKVAAHSGEYNLQYEDEGYAFVFVKAAD